MRIAPNGDYLGVFLIGRQMTMVLDILPVCALQPSEALSSSLIAASYWDFDISESEITEVKVDQFQYLIILIKLWD